MAEDVMTVARALAEQGVHTRGLLPQFLRALNAAGLAVVSRKITDEQAREFAKSSPAITDVARARTVYAAMLAAGELRPASGEET